MNDKIEEKRRLNKVFEVFESTFEKKGLQVIGKGINVTSSGTEVYVEMLVNDKSKANGDLKIMVNMYDSNDCIEFHEDTYIETKYLEDLYTVEITFYNVGLKDLKNIEKIRIYLVKIN